MHDDKCSCKLSLKIKELKTLLVSGDFHRNKRFKSSRSCSTVPKFPSSEEISKNLSPTSMTFGRGPIKWGTNKVGKENEVGGPLVESNMSWQTIGATEEKKRD